MAGDLYRIEDAITFEILHMLAGFRDNFDQLEHKLETLFGRKQSLHVSRHGIAPFGRVGCGLQIDNERS